GGVSAVLAVALSLWLAARVSRPIRLLGAAAERFGAGQRAAAVEVGSRDELGQLSRSFNLMVAQIDERTEALRREVAERLQAEERMRRSERYFRSLIENASDVVTVVDGDGVTRYVSPSVTRVLGHAPEDLLGAGYLKHVHPDDAGRLEAAHGRARQEPSEPVSCEFRLRHANGGWRLVQVVLNNQLADQAVAGIVANLQDVTERKQAEMRLAQATRLESIGRLAAGIGHEINTPMQFIGDNTLFLQDAFAGLMRLQELQTRLLASGQEAGVLPPEAVTELAATREAVGLDFLETRVPQALQRSREGVDRVSQLVRAMRELSHPGTKELVPVDLNRTIEHALVLSHHEWKYVADTRLELDPELPLVQGLPGELSQVLLNLIVNAAHAIGDALGPGPEVKGTIAIATRCHGDQVEVRLRDTGTGIPAEVQPHVFDLFFTTKEVGKGTGQGLAMAHDVVVTKHRGELFFESEEGVGTTFVLRLPVDGRHGSAPGSSDR
ncbi:MAG: PAS domain S-box protein, partial [Candidatus Latescibacterota bacterium]